MEDIKEKLSVIQDAILNTVPAKLIYLFGSYAYGTPDKNSDIDIYAVIPDDFNENIPNTMGKITRYLGDFGIFFIDLFLVKEKDFSYYKENSSFEDTICNKGILLYES